MPYLTPVQMLGVAGDLRALDTLVAYGLSGTARQRVATLSAGQQQRLALAVVKASSTPRTATGCSTCSWTSWRQVRASSCPATTRRSPDAAMNSLT